MPFEKQNLTHLGYSWPRNNPNFVQRQILLFKYLASFSLFPFILLMHSSLLFPPLYPDLPAADGFGRAGYQVLKVLRECSVYFATGTFTD